MFCDDTWFYVPFRCIVPSCFWFRKLIEQSMSNPRREPDIPRPRAPALFSTPHPTILTPVPPRFPHQVQHPFGQTASIPAATSAGVVSMTGMSFYPTTGENISIPLGVQQWCATCSLRAKCDPRKKIVQSAKTCQFLIVCDPRNVVII